MKIDVDVETKIKSQGLFLVACSFELILVLSAVFNCLQPLKQLVTKLHKLNQDIYMAYSLIDLIMSDLKRYQENIDEEFKT